MRTHRRLRRGIFLITTLMLVTFLIMLASGIFISVQQGFAMSGSLSNRELAKHAALNGMNFLQAQLETNCGKLAPPPDGAGASNSIINSSDGAMTVVENGWNVAGWMSNTNVTGVGEQSVYLMFQACFNKSYSAYSASLTPPVVNGIQLPAMTYASVDNLLRPALTGNTASSYLSTGAVYQTVPGQMADVIVMGYVMSPDGRVLASRLAEGMFTVGQVGDFQPAGAVAQSDVDLQIISSTGDINVGLLGSSPNTYNGLASFTGNINTIGLVPSGAGTAPPIYNSTAKVAVNGSSQFNYQGSSGSTSYPQDTQLGAPSPPTIAASSLPGLTNPVNVSAGTWVIWGTPNAALYHYPIDYPTVGMTGGSPMPVQNLPWTQPTSTAAPWLNGTGPDQGPLTSLDAGHQLPLTQTPASTAGNSITITANDVNVAPVTVAGAPVTSFSLLVAPTETNSGVQIIGSAAPSGNAQLVFQPGGTQTSLQFRDPGTITIMGNVTGAGSLQATGTSSDVNVIGKSTLDPRADNGVALYATGNVDVWGAVDANGNTLAQLPSSVGSYVPILQTNPQNVTGASPGPTVAPQAASDLMTNLEWTAAAFPSATQSLSPGNTITPTPVGVTDGASYSGGTFTLNIDANGTGNSSQLVAVAQSGATAATWCGGIFPAGFAAMQPALTAYNAGNKAQAQALFGQVLLDMGMTTSDGVNYTISVALANSVTTTGEPLSNPSPSPSGSGGPLPSFDQAFNGLVYASSNFYASTNGAFTVNGGLISNTGKITVDSSNITLNYNANSIGQFSGLFGNHVTLHRNTVTVY